MCQLCLISMILKKLLVPPKATTETRGQDFETLAIVLDVELNRMFEILLR